MPQFCGKMPTSSSIQLTSSKDNESPITNSVYDERHRIKHQIIVTSCNFCHFIFPELLAGEPRRLPSTKHLRMHGESSQKGRSFIDSAHCRPSDTSCRKIIQRTPSSFPGWLRVTQSVQLSRMDTAIPTVCMHQSRPDHSVSSYFCIFMLFLCRQPVERLDLFAHQGPGTGPCPVGMLFLTQSKKPPVRVECLHHPKGSGDISQRITIRLCQ